jgi:hypothetical protein
VADGGDDMYHKPIFPHTNKDKNTGQTCDLFSYNYKAKDENIIYETWSSFPVICIARVKLIYTLNFKQLK